MSISSGMVSSDLSVHLKPSIGHHRRPKDTAQSFFDTQGKQKQGSLKDIRKQARENWLLPGEVILHTALNLGYVKKKEGLGLEYCVGTLFVTSFRLYFLYSLDDTKKSEKNIMLKSHISNRNLVQKPLPNFNSMVSVMTPITNIWKIEEKSLNAFQSIVIRCKGPQILQFRILTPPSDVVGTSIYDQNGKPYKQSRHDTLLRILLNLLVGRKISQLFAYKYRAYNDAKYNKSGQKTKPPNKIISINRMYNSYPNITQHEEKDSTKEEETPQNSSFLLPYYSGFVFKPVEISQGWKVYDAQREFKRQGALSSHCWRETTLNHSYGLCASYPRTLVVPSTVTDDELKNCSRYRSKERVPVLTWLHPENGSCIVRSSQPLSGLLVRSNNSDVFLLNEIRNTTSSKQMVIIDCRPKANAWANTVLGKGFENINSYESTTIEFMGIDNIHTMSASLSNLLSTCKKRGDSTWVQLFDGTGWLKHIQLILKATHRITCLLEKQKAPVLIRCSDGWDRTPQCCALAQICLDPYFRTIEGFQVLIEKDWISFGHKFQHRNGMLHHDTEYSPIFFQFIDVVWHLWCQYPDYFEFNELYLLTIIDHVYSGMFGNFLFNTEKQRHLKKNNVKDKTLSVWSLLNHPEKRPHYVNSLYKPTDHRRVIYPDSHMHTLLNHLWTRLYFRYEIGVKKKTDTLMKKKLTELQLSNAKLTQRLRDEEEKARAWKERYEQLEGKTQQNNNRSIDSHSDISEDSELDHSKEHIFSKSVVGKRVEITFSADLKNLKIQDDYFECLINEQLERSFEDPDVAMMEDA